MVELKSDLQLLFEAMTDPKKIDDNDRHHNSECIEKIKKLLKSLGDYDFKPP
jgi:hypothetical protein